MKNRFPRLSTASIQRLNIVMLLVIVALAAEVIYLSMPTRMELGDKVYATFPPPSRGLDESTCPVVMCSECTIYNDRPEAVTVIVSINANERTSSTSSHLVVPGSRLRFDLNQPAAVELIVVEPL